MILSLTLNPAEERATPVGASLRELVSPNASLVVATSAEIANEQTGWAEIVASSEAAGYCVFHHRLPDGLAAEETVPFELFGQRSVFLALRQRQQSPHRSGPGKSRAGVNIGRDDRPKNGVSITLTPVVAA